MNKSFLSNVTFLVVAFLAVAWASAALGHCLKHPPQGYVFIKQEKMIEQFQNKSTNLIMSVKCEPANLTSAKLHESLATNLDLVSLKNLIFYFEFNSADVMSRSYFVPTKPIKQISFISASTNAKALVNTEKLVEEMSKD